MRILAATTVLASALLAAAPARAIDLDSLLKQTFGTADPGELGGPIFALIAMFSGLFFWIALRIGKKRQRKMIEDYNTQMREYSARLRRGKS